MSWREEALSIVSWIQQAYPMFSLSLLAAASKPELTGVRLSEGAIMLLERKYSYAEMIKRSKTEGRTTE